MKLIYAWDDPLPEGEKLPDNLRQVMQSVDRVKINPAVFTEMGPGAVRLVQEDIGGKVFLDLKFHDIPNTVQKAAAGAARLGVSMFNVHAKGGIEMMKAAVDGARSTVSTVPLVIAVTLLTSEDRASLEAIGMWPVGASNVASIVRTLADNAQRAGCDGVVCSAQEARLVRETCGEDFIIVCPAIRPPWAAVGDQKRPTTPEDALLAGASEIVLGRAVSDPPPEIGDPFKALQLIREDIAFALGG